jgi:hypothetical protein
LKQYLIPAILSLLVTLIGGIFLWRLKKEKLSLQYDLIESGSFPRENGEGKYFVIRLKNTGNKAIENSSLEISFETGSIETVRVSDNNLLSAFTQESSKISGTLPLLNPKEVIEITITTIGKQSISSPRIIARAIGVTAVQAKEIEFSSGTFILAIALLASITAAITMYVVINQKMRNLEMTKEEILAAVKEADRMQGPEREDQIFAVLNRAGLSHIFPQLISTGSDITYKDTGFFLMHQFLVENESNKQKIISAMENLQQLEEVAPTSRSIILYLLAKMEQTRGNHSKATYYLKTSQAAAPRIYDHLMAQDPSYDIQSLKKWLLTHGKH